VEETKSFEGQLQTETRTEPGVSETAQRALRVPGLTVLFHPDPSRIGERVVLTGLVAGRAERLARAEPAFSQPGGTALRPLADPYISRGPLLLSPGRMPGSVVLSTAETRTAITADGEPVTGERMLSAAQVERGVVLLMSNRIVLLLSLVDPGGFGVPRFGLVGESAPLLELCREIQRISALEVPVLLRGETGTGKELVARALHDAGPRKGRPYLAVNLGAIPASLAAAELFGASRGAYTGADRKRDGFFARAHGGTLFLDEVGEASPEVQVLLLRALENREIQPVGGGEVIPVDVRLVAATDSNLEAAVMAERFRAPLLYRLSGYEIELPTLRARRDDIGRLFFHFLRQELQAIGAADRLRSGEPDARPWLPPALVARIAQYDWPGNVRQLRNAARQIAIAGQGRGQVPLSTAWERAPADPVEGEPAKAAVPDLAKARAPRKTYRDPAEIGEEELLAALRAHRFRLQPTAVALGVSRPSLYDRIDRSTKVRKAVDLSSEEIAAAYGQCSGDLDAMVELLEVSRKGLRRRMTQLGLAAPDRSSESDPALD
jgi:two-component system nitrogen regulation response regulator GlnG